MANIDQLQNEIGKNKRELEIRKKVFLAECAKELEMLIKMERWVDYIKADQLMAEVPNGEEDK